MTKDLGIDLKDLVKVISKIKNKDSKDNEIIVKRRKKRKNKKSKKKKVTEPLQNTKPNFGHQNQIGGGGGGIGGTSYNPLAQQRSAPAVTTVVNTPPTGGQTGGQTEHYNKLYESTQKGYELLRNGVIDSVNYLGDKIDEVNK